MGRSICLTDDRTDAANDDDCCIIARTAIPDGYGPKPVPYPLITHGATYNSYGANYAVPLPYHKHGYQATAMVDDYHTQVGHPIRKAGY